MNTDKLLKSLKDLGIWDKMVEKGEIKTFNTRQEMEQYIKKENIDPNTMLNHSSDYGRKLVEETFTKKIGRNNPCPCGSGIKFKRCCIWR